MIMFGISDTIRFTYPPVSPIFAGWVGLGRGFDRFHRESVCVCVCVCVCMHVCMWISLCTHVHAHIQHVYVCMHANNIYVGVLHGECNNQQDGNCVDDGQHKLTAPSPCKASSGSSISGETGRYSKASPSSSSSSLKKTLSVSLSSLGQNARYHLRHWIDMLTIISMTGKKHSLSSLSLE